MVYNKIKKGAFNFITMNNNAIKHRPLEDDAKKESVQNPDQRIKELLETTRGPATKILKKEIDENWPTAPQQ